MGFSELELDLIGTKAFQRLRSIKQLGLAHYVYPTADYSRFSHSLGVCHLAGRVMARISADDDELRLTRLAALLHDIGHYPFSHCLEHAIKRFYSKKIVENDEIDFDLSKKPLDHEQVGERVLANDEEVRSILDREQIDPGQISNRFRREGPNYLGTQVVTSDFDMDRTDFLIRTAHAAGLPYGKVDLNYLIGELVKVPIDGRDRIALPTKALRAADHFLLSRYFDYQQVAYHKTVTGFEQVMEEAISYLLEKEVISLTEDDVESLIATGEWFWFTDESLLTQVKAGAAEFDRENEPPALRFKALARAILDRRPPKLVGECEFIGKQPEETRTFSAKADEAETEILGIDGVGEHLVFWSKDGHTLTSMGTVHDLKDEQTADKLVLVKSPDGSIRPLIEERRSLMSVLSNYAWCCFRVYALDTCPIPVVELRRKISAILRATFFREGVSGLNSSE